MKKILLLIAGLWVAGAVNARELVVTLHGGQRLAFHLSATDEVLMTQTADQVMLNGMALERANIEEMRVFQQRPEDAIAVGVLAPEAEQPVGESPAVYDLSGRRVADSALQWMKQKQHNRAGVYLINNKKVIIR